MRRVTEWAFSAPLSQVDVPRILREARLAETPGRIVVFTIDGVVFTAWREVDFPGRVGVVQDYGLSWLDLSSPFAGRRPLLIDSPVSVFRWDGDDVDGTGIRVERGDHRAALVDLVETRVEVF
jgi:hypothetical protein